MRKFIIVAVASLLSQELYAMNHQYIGLQGSSVRYERNILKKSGDTNENYENTRNTYVDVIFNYCYHFNKRIAFQLDLGLDVDYTRKFEGDDQVGGNQATGSISIGPNLVFNLRPGTSFNPFITVGGGFIKNIDFNATNESGYTVAKETSTSDTGIFYRRNAYSLFAQLGLSFEVPMSFFRANNVSWKPGIFAIYTRFMGDNLKAAVADNNVIATTDTYTTYHGLTLKVFLLAFTLGF